MRDRLRKDHHSRDKKGGKGSGTSSKGFPLYLKPPVAAAVDAAVDAAADAADTADATG